MPGIEGREEIVINEINDAVERAHAVFYISGKSAPPQNGDEKSEGTIEKIKRHLQHTEVYFIYNKRVKNPRQLKEVLISEDEKMALKEVDDVLKKFYQINMRDIKFLVLILHYYQWEIWKINF